jgi:hypothetical protein
LYLVLSKKLRKESNFTSFVIPSLLRTEAAGILATCLVDTMEEICCTELERLNQQAIQMHDWLVFLAFFPYLIIKHPIILNILHVLHMRKHLYHEDSRVSAWLLLYPHSLKPITIAANFFHAIYDH